MGGIISVILNLRSCWGLYSLGKCCLVKYRQEWRDSMLSVSLVKILSYIREKSNVSNNFYAPVHFL